jgi:hypothetical protein
VPQLLNHYSYAIAGALALIAVGWWAATRRTVRAIAVLLVAAIVVVGADLVLRPGEPSLTTVADFDRALSAGKPALVEFYSNY